MNKRHFMHGAGITVATLGMGQSIAGEERPEVKPAPNILLIFSDQQHWRAAGFMDSFFDTPNLDALAKESVVFERSFCTTPQCSPSRSSLLTGFYPTTTGVMGNVGNAGGNPLDQPTLAPELQHAGYRTGYFGKWHLGDKAVGCAGWDAHVFKTNDPTAEEKTLEFLRDPRTQKQPFALVVSINNPHDIYQFKRHQLADKQIPLPASWEKEHFVGKPPIQQQFMNEDQGRAIVGQPRREWERYVDCYRAKIKLFDDHVGVILDKLKRQGQYENTIIIVTSDHGDMDAHHRLIFKGPFMYEHMVRVPLMIRLPKTFGGTGPRHVSDIDVVNVDIAPTLRDICGLPAKPSHGLSLAPLLTGAGTYTPREFVVSQYYSKQRWVNPIRMIRTKRYKLNRHIRWGDELYDLQNDPDELKNLADDPEYAAVHRELAEKLNRWIKDHNDPFYSLDVTSRQGKKLP